MNINRYRIYSMNQFLCNALMTKIFLEINFYDMFFFERAEIYSMQSL
jgi:hypothetical protein